MVYIWLRRVRNAKEKTFEVEQVERFSYRFHNNVKCHRYSIFSNRSLNNILGTCGFNLSLFCCHGIYKYAFLFRKYYVNIVLNTSRIRIIFARELIFI